RHPKPRKVTPLLRSALEAHPRSLIVQEAFCEGCCALLSGEQLILGIQPALLWTSLWPLAAHARREIAEAASLALCRLTWLSKAPAAAGSAGDHQSAPSVDEAIETACSEFSDVFATAARSADAAGASTLAAQAHSERLLEHLHRLVLFGRGPAQQASAGRRGQRGGATEDSLVVVLPIARLVGTIDSVVVAILRDSSKEARAGRAARAALARGLELAAALAEVAGAALLPHTAQVRKWLEYVAVLPRAGQAETRQAACGLVVALAGSAPSALLRGPLLKQLAHFCLAGMRPDGSHGQGTAAAPPASTRKRKASAFDEGPAAGAGTSSSLQSSADGQAVDVFRSACLVLAPLLSLGAPLLQAPDLSAVAEQAARVLWLGILAPPAAEATHETVYYRAICQDGPSVMAILDVFEALHRPPRIGAGPLAPGLLNAILALVDAVAAAFQRRPATRSGERSRSAIGHDFVRARALQLRSALAAAGQPLAGGASAATAAASQVTIAWPEAAPAEAHGTTHQPAPPPVPLAGGAAPGEPAAAKEQAQASETAAPALAPTSGDGGGGGPAAEGTQEPPAAPPPPAEVAAAAAPLAQEGEGAPGNLEVRGNEKGG
ncbi:unnamed protein product, partial [Prorocentrum cordatum]